MKSPSNMMSKPTAEIVPLYAVNASDVAAMLRQAADSIETEEAEGYSPTRAMAAVQISENGGIQIYGWGRTDTMHSLALLHLGVAKLQQHVLEEED